TGSRAAQRRERDFKKSGRVLCEATAVKYAWMRTQTATHSIRMLCRALNVSASGWYAWRAREPSARARENERLAVTIKNLHHEFREAYGTERLWRELRDRGE